MDERMDRWITQTGRQTERQTVQTEGNEWRHTDRQTDISSP